MLLYHPVGRVSGPRLADFMGIPHGRRLSKPSDFLIRWGTAEKIRHHVTKEINPRSALRSYFSRIQQLTILRDAGVCVPEFSRTPVGYPMLGRNERRGRSSSRGMGITYYPEPCAHPDHSYYVRFYPKQRQFRVHVCNDSTRTRELIHELEVVGSDASNLEDAWAQPIWNLNTGFTYRLVRGKRPKGVIPNAKLAVKSLGLDFGAVDVIVHDNTPYVLEVNTAPGLSDMTMAWYAERLGDLVGIPYSSMPGAVNGYDD